MLFKTNLIRIHSFVSEQLGIDPLKTWAGLRGFPEFVRDLFKFRRDYRGELILNPYLGDRYREGGSTKNEYFWQDLLVAQCIYQAQPLRHVDVGSRIDGFVAHVASFRAIEVFDIRPVDSLIPGVKFTQADLMSADSVARLCAGGDGYCDSLSCLHAIEHFGLGRYGDPVNPLGFRFGIENLSKLLQLGGRLYLSTPIGSERVEFNANWVFDPNTILSVANAAGLRLDELTVVDQQGGHERVLHPSAEKLNALAKEHYRLGIFHFLKESGH
ncbi:DUF268 domain-containing protein [Burkholderiaceae bacterium]|jgi:hypothetical protein|nr:DUF268 domain-containing protein [Burkholderiaceae bacterium]